MPPAMPMSFGRAAIVIAALLVLPGVRGPAAAQGDATARVNLTVEQRHVVKELVKELKVPPVTADVPSAIGDTVPDSVVAQPVPVEVAQRVPQIRAHSFFVKDERIVLVNPKDRKVSDVIE